MRKIYNLLLLSTLLLFGASNAWADYGWYDWSMTIGSATTNFSTWSGDPDHPTNLGDLTDMTITNIAFKIWSDANDRGGANMYFRVYDNNGQVGDDQDIWLGGATRIAGDHDFSISYSTPVDLAAAVGLTLEEGEIYYIDMWAKTYGDAGDEWYSNGGANYHAKFTYAPNKATIGATGWTTFSRSYPLDLSNMTASTGSVTAFYASSANASYVTMTSTTATIAANEGIMLKGTAGAEITIPVSASAGSALSGNLLVGCPTGTTVNHNDGSGWNYVLFNNNGVAEFQHIVSGDHQSVTIPAGKAYLALGANPSGSAPSAFRIVEEENNTTDIQKIENSETAVKFIENGKLFIQKNGVVYDMIGRVVR